MQFTEQSFDILVKFSQSVELWTHNYAPEHPLIHFPLEPLCQLKCTF